MQCTFIANQITLLLNNLQLNIKPLRFDEINRNRKKISCLFNKILIPIQLGGQIIINNFVTCNSCFHSVSLIVNFRF